MRSSKGIARPGTTQREGAVRRARRGTRSGTPLLRSHRARADRSRGSRRRERRPARAERRRQDDAPDPARGRRRAERGNDRARRGAHGLGAATSGALPQADRTREPAPVRRARAARESARGGRPAARRRSTWSTPPIVRPRSCRSATCSVSTSPSAWSPIRRSSSWTSRPPASTRGSVGGCGSSCAASPAAAAPSSSRPRTSRRRHTQADRLVVLQEGRLVFSGPQEQFWQQAGVENSSTGAFERAFVRFLDAAGRGGFLMRAIRALLSKDIRILRRSPLTVALLVIYPLALAVLVGAVIADAGARPARGVRRPRPPPRAGLDRHPAHRDRRPAAQRQGRGVARPDEPVEGAQALSRGDVVAVVDRPAGVPGPAQEPALEPDADARDEPRRRARPRAARGAVGRLPPQPAIAARAPAVEHRLPAHARARRQRAASSAAR